MTSARAYYNENDPRAAAWLRELIKCGWIAPGDVDERSIEDVYPVDLWGYDQCHFFAGIGGWSYALRLAGVLDDQPVWTGSCPCQPFSAAGKGKGLADERHLWPAWFHLIEQCRPAILFGEQVASPAGLGWFDLVSSDLEGANYATGAADLCAAGVGAPHIRQRLYWVAESDRGQRNRGPIAARGYDSHGAHAGRTEGNSGVAGRIEACALGDSGSARGRRDGGAIPGTQSGAWWEMWRKSDLAIATGGVGRPDDERSQGRSERRNGTSERSPWEASMVDCRDGKRRPVEPGTFPLAHGVPGRVGLLRGYGNAIVPQVAATFVRAYEETRAAHE